MKSWKKLVNKVKKIIRTRLCCIARTRGSASVCANDACSSAHPGLAFFAPLTAGQLVSYCMGLACYNSFCSSSAS